MLADPLSMPQKATPHDSLPHDSLPHDSLPHDSLPHDSLPHDSMSHDSQPLLLECRGVDVRVSSRTLVASLDMQVRGGRMLAILGPNGCGKSLSLQTFAGLRPLEGGELLISARPLGDWPRRTLARELAFLPQNVEDPFPATVLETVLLGRHPHIPRWQWESARDLAIASEALVAVGLKGYEERSVFTLSGGERRRAALAAVLAQTPRIFLLDEPTNQLDPNHQLEALQLLRQRADEGAAVIVTLHDPNLAARFADDALLIGAGGHWQYGGIANVLTAEHLSELYATRFETAVLGKRRVFFQS
jgi:iron complex transport system ATP-binding protein